MRARLQVAIVAMVAVAGCGGATSSSQDGHPATVAPTSTGPASPDDAVADTLAGLDADRVLSVRLGDPPHPSATSPKHWMHATLRPDVDDTLTLWKADLALGAIGQRLGDGEALMPDTIGGTARFVGDEHREGLSMGYAPMDPHFVYADQGLSDDDIASRARAALATFSMVPEEVRVLRPLGPALEVVVRLDRDQLSTPIPLDAIAWALGGQRDAYNVEGLYLEMRDPSGRPIAVARNAGRLAVGSVWVDPAYDSEFPFNHG